MEPARRSAPPSTEVSSPDASLEERRRVVEAALDRSLPSPTAWPETIHRAVRYSLFAGGKRIRPLLALAAAEAAGAGHDEALPFACAVEVVHTYSLIHDDLPAMDDDDLRRGKPTCHKVFGEAIAILAGDALLTRAFHLVVDVPADGDGERVRRRLAAAAILGEACGTSGLIGGQVMDLESEGKVVDAATLERLHRAKTGALLGACVRGGAVLGGAAAPTLSCLERYASAIGLAFQVVDDILDATEGAEQLGKTAGKDRAAGKATYVQVHGLAGARRAAADLLAQAREAILPLGPRGELLDVLARRIVERRA
jgi:geranylgeranyl diphosphate synthase, type II